MSKPAVEEMFEDVYQDLPANLAKQRKELAEHLREYGEYYPLDKFEQS
jgi:2-oxoisovalerate dehydrogenase E1 component alpha subunit